MFPYYLEIIFLSIIQGISEFIPVSSSAHLILISKIGKFSAQSLEIDISLHFGSLLAIVCYFFKDLVKIFENKNILKLIVIGSMPIILAGSALYYLEIIYKLRDIKIIAWSTLIFGLLLYISDKKIENKNLEKDLNLKNIFIIGFFQILAFIPGASRSGITITSGRIIGFNRVDSAKISFFLSIPALTAASILGLKDFTSNNIGLNLAIILSTLFSFIFSYLTIKFLLLYLKKFTLNIFVLYRIIISLILFFMIYS